LQLLLFLAALGVWYDYRTVRAAGGGWSELRVVYRLKETRRLATYAVPVALALLALGQQVVSGTGTDFVKGVLETVPKLLGQ
jgi:hypothetical protein